MTTYAAHWARSRRRLAAAGAWVDPFVSTTASVEHIEHLRSTYGLSFEGVAQLAGMQASHLVQIVTPAHHQYRDRIRIETQAKILAARFDLDALSDSTLVAVEGTRRRVQALSRIGWSRDLVAARMGTSESALACNLDRPHSVTARVARAVRDVYDELSMTPGPKSKAISWATRQGWPPPLAWDDDEIDAVTAQPDLGTDTVRSSADVAAEVEWIFAQADPLATADVIAARLGYSDRSGVQAALTRAERFDLLNRLSRNAEIAGHNVRHGQRKTDKENAA